MKTLNAGGNPTQDRQSSVKRFSEIVEPVFSKQGFKRLKGNSHAMYSEHLNTILLVTSCTSQTKMVRYTRDKIKDYRKMYGSDLKVFILYTRDFSEWKNKPTYQSVLRQIMDIKTITGIATGLGNLPTTLNKITQGEPFFSIG
jgi:hypothetical protein